MPYEPEDEAGWSSLPAASSGDEDESHANSVGPLHTGTEPYIYHSKQFADQLTLVAQPEKGKHIIELGAGCGLVGLVFAAHGANVLLTDLPNVMGMLEKNISLNEATILRGGGSAQCCELTWGVTPLDALPQAWRVPDLLVAADVVYHRELFQLLLTCLKAFGNTPIVLAHVRRWKSDATFFKQAKKLFDMADITVEINVDAGKFSSHTQGEPRLFRLQART